MNLKEPVDIVSFLDTVKKCSGSVFFQTTEGDILNLKSLLSQYVLTTIVCNPDLLKSAQIICVEESDYQILADFLVR